MQKYIYDFDEAFELEKNRLGGKGRSLVDMTSLGLPVPPGFIITTETGYFFSKKNYQVDHNFTSQLDAQIDKLAKRLSSSSGKKVNYGDQNNPFLVSVRSGAPVSMPGQMSTIINVGLTSDYFVGNDIESDLALKLFWGNCRSFAIAYGVDDHGLEEIQREVFERNASETPKKASEKILEMLQKETGKEFIEILKDPKRQLLESIKLVWKSWESKHTKEYRKSLGMKEDNWTAVIIQAMVYGNKNNQSGSGVVYSRDLISGLQLDPLPGSFLFNIQGELIVSGESKGSDGLSLLQKQNKTAYKQLKEGLDALEKFYRFPLDVEITVEDGQVWFLQVRQAPVSDRGLVQFVVDQTSGSGSFRFGEREAVENISPSLMERLNLPSFSEKSIRKAVIAGNTISAGIPASPGAGVGRIAVTKHHAEALVARGEEFIWVKDALDPKEHQIMGKSSGIISMGSSVGSHGAIIANVLKKPCVVCCEQITEVNSIDGYIQVNGSRLYEKDSQIISVDAMNGIVYRGKLEKVLPRPFPALKKFMRSWEKHDGTKENIGVINFEDGRPHSPWGNATDPSKYSLVDEYRRQIVHFLNEKAWNTEKAQVVEAMKIIPEPMRIKQVVVDAKDQAGLEAALHDVIKEKHSDGSPLYWNGPRTALGPDAEGSAPWQMGMKTKQQIHMFFSDKNFKGVDKAKSGGYPRWMNPEPDDPWKAPPAQIIVMYDPAEKGVEEYEHEHFACNISCRSNPDEVTVDINLGTAQLRSFETIRPDKLVRLTMEIRRENPHFVGRRTLRFGKGYWNLKAPTLSKEFPGLPSLEIERSLDERMEIGELPETLYSDLVGERNLKVARQVESIVFGSWWIENQLPYRMRALDEVFSLQVLELQGRANNDGDIIWFLVYDAKGRDEKKTVSYNGNA